MAIRLPRKRAVRPRRLPRQPEAHTIHVKLSSEAPTPGLVSSLVRDLTKHLMYSRGQIAVCYDQLVQQQVVPAV